MYKLPAEIRTLTNFASILGPLGEHLHRWTQAGQFGYLFDNVEDTLSFTRFQTFNFDGWDKYPDVLEPMLFYVLQRASTEIERPENAATFKLFVIDEGWIFFQETHHPRLDHAGGKNVEEKESLHDPGHAIDDGAGQLRACWSWSTSPARRASSSLIPASTASSMPRPSSLTIPS